MKEIKEAYDNHMLNFLEYLERQKKNKTTEELNFIQKLSAKIYNSLEAPNKLLADELEKKSKKPKATI